jgi:hypothetical protein
VKSDRSTLVGLLLLVDAALAVCLSGLLVSILKLAW